MVNFYVALCSTAPLLGLLANPTEKPGQCDKRQRRKNRRADGEVVG
jgi:hypothetical protein